MKKKGSLYEKKSVNYLHIYILNAIIYPSTENKDFPSKGDIKC